MGIFFGSGGCFWGVFVVVWGGFGCLGGGLGCFGVIRWTDFNWGPISRNNIISKYIAVLSAKKKLTTDLTCSGRSLMYARKRTGPRTECCGGAR